MVSNCIYLLCWWNVGRSLCGILGQQMGQVCTLIIHITADRGIIICRRQLLQSYGQLLYSSTVLVECGQSLCRILGQQIGQVCTLIIHITAYMWDNYLSQTASTILRSVTVSIYCVVRMLGGVSAGYWANKWGRYVHLLCLSQQLWRGELFVTDSFYNLMVSYCIHLLCWGMLGGVSAGYWANKWGRYVHLLYLSQQLWRGELFVTDSFYNLMVSYCIHLLCWGMLGGVSAEYWANKWGRYVHLLSYSICVILGQFWYFILV